MNASLNGLNKIQRRVVFRRWLAFNAVGALGILIQLAALNLLTSLLGWNYLAATAAAVEAALLHNYVWHERWTWAERASGDASAICGRLIRWHLTNGALSLLGNLLLMWWFVEGLSLNSTLANLLAIAICSVLNFFAGERLVFTQAV